MKKGIGILLCMASLLSCTKQVQEHDVCFTVFTEQAASKAVGDASQATQLLVGVLDNNDQPLDKFLKVVNRASGESFSFKLPLMSQLSYKLLLFAQKPDQYVNAQNFTSASILRSIALPGVLVLNNDEGDAFAGVKTLSGAATQYTVELTHAWAQVNVASSESIDDVSGVVLSIAEVPTKYDILTQKAVGSQSLTVSGTALSGQTFTAERTDYRYIGYAYIPVGAEGIQASVTVTITRGAAPLESISESTVNNVPLKANYRTNILGKL